MKAVLVLFLCLILSWHLSAGVSASAENPDVNQTAYELLKLSEDQDEDLAIQTTQKALALFQSANNQKGIGDSYHALGRYYFALNKLNEATQNYELALQIWRQRQDTENQVRALTQLGYIEGRKGEWVNGFSYYMQAQTLDDQSNKGAMARIASGMGYVFNESGLPANGLTQYQRAKEYFQQDKDDKFQRGYNRMGMMVGYTYFLLGNYPAALRNLEDAFEHFKSSEDKDAEGDSIQCEEYIGRVYLETGQYDLALKSLLPSLPYLEHKGQLSEAAEVKALIGKVYQRQGKIELARTNYQDALNNLHEETDSVKRASVAFALGRLELNQRNYEAAENYLKESIKTTEDIRSDLDSRMLATAFSASVHERYETYIECLMQRHKEQQSRGLELQAFQASELVRARSLAAMLRDTRIVTGVNPRLAEREKTLRQAVHKKAEETISLLAMDYKKEELDKSEKSLTVLREEHQQLTQQLEKQNPHYNQIKETANLSVPQVQKLIVEDSETMLLEYFLGKNASYAWAITRNDARVYVLPKADEITDKVRVVYDLLTKKPDDDTEKRLKIAGGDLAKMILTPLANQSNIKRVIVVADDALNYIPFQLLPSPSGEPLVANYEIVNAPSASVLGQLREEKQQRAANTKVLAAFGDPVFRSNYAQFKNSASDDVVAAAATERGLEVDADSLDPDKIQSLVYSKDELNYLREIAGQGALVAGGFKASRAMLESTDFSRYSILHFATHSLFDPKNPKKLGLYLSMINEAGQDEDGFITMQDVYNLRVPVSLVVLSACRTGLGEDVRGEGLIGLTRGFMHAGASSVVASLWKVDDEATAELMKYFYTNMLKKGMRPAAALREAQNTLRQNPQWSSPHYWAGFTLQGEFKDQIKLPPPTTAPHAVQNAVGAGLLITLLMGIGWGYLRRRRA